MRLVVGDYVVMAIPYELRDGEVLHGQIEQIITDVDVKPYAIVERPDGRLFLGTADFLQISSRA